MKLYKEGEPLKENEFLLKIRVNPCKTNTGFMTKLNKDGSIPKAFKEWSVDKYWTPNSEHDKDFSIFKVEERFRNKWKIEGFRYGKSQNWAILVHPDCFTLEIYLDDFLKIIKENIIEKGVIIGEFKWDNNKLIKNETPKITHAL